MKSKQPKKGFNWSRVPSREGIHSVYIANPIAYVSFGREISRSEMANSLATWNRINELKAKKLLFKRLFIATLASIPFLIIIHNMITSIIQSTK